MLIIPSFTVGTAVQYTIVKTLRSLCLYASASRINKRASYIDFSEIFFKFNLITKPFLMISNWKETFGLNDLYKNISAFSSS